MSAEVGSELAQVRRQLAVAEQQVQVGLRRHRMLLGSMVNYAVIVFDLHGLVTEWSEGARRLFGWTKAEMVGLPTAVFYTEEDREAGVSQADMSAALREDREIGERWHLRKDGSRFWAHGEMMLLKDEVGVVHGFVQVLRDRTQQHQAGEKNRADAEFLRSVLASSTDCIKVLDLDAKLTFMSEGGQRVMEVSDVNKILGCSWPDFWHGKGNEDAIAAVRAAQTGDAGHFCGTANTMAGTSKWWDVRVTPIFGADGRPEKLLSVSRDITEMHDAEASLRASEQHWRGLFERLQEGLITGELVRDAGGRIVDWRYLDVNLAWSKMVGLEQGGAIGRTIREVFPGIEEAWIDEAGAVVQSGEPATFIRQVGTLGRWYEGRIYRIGPERFTVIFQEVTERYLAEHSRAVLLELGDRLRGEGDSAALARAGCEVIGRALGVVRMGYAPVSMDSQALVSEMEWTADGCRNLAGRFRIGDSELFAAALRRGETVVISDTREDPRTAATSAELESVSVRALINLPVIERGRLVAVIYVNANRPRLWTTHDRALVQDAAERLRQAIERRRAEHDLQSLATSLEQQVTERTRERDIMWNTSPDLLLVIDFNGVFRQVNPTWTVLLGYAVEELVGHHVNEFVLTSDHDETVGAYELAAHGGVPRIENRYRHKDGSTRWISWVAAPANEMTYATGRDVTAEKEREAELAKAQDALRQSQKMEAVGQLTGGLAHDFNNLLAGVTGSLELMQTRIAQGRVKDVERYVNAAQGAAKRAAALTHRLLAFSRRQTLDPKSTDMNRLIQGMEDLVQRTVGPEITVEAVGAGGLWATLVDRGQLENALLNLCINARDAMPDGGKITIETANRWMDERTARERDLRAGPYVSLCVSDTGSGMSPEVIAKAFEPFFTTKPIGMGTGLGLSMIYGFAKQSSGQAQIYSEVEKGTTVSIYLPRYMGDETAPDLLPEMNALPRAEAGQTVLVVDDEPTVRMLVSEVLGDLGYTAIEAADGAAGLKILQSTARIDLLVTDVGLPGGLNGRQVADAARVARPHMKVLFITGYAENAVLSHGHLDPGMHVLTKPFALEALATRIKDLISGS